MKNEDLKIVPSTDYAIERVTVIIHAPLYGPGGMSPGDLLMGLIDDDNELQRISTEECTNVTLVDLRGSL